MALVEGKGRGRELCEAGISILDEGDRGGADPPEGDEPREVGGDYPFGRDSGSVCGRGCGLGFPNACREDF